MSWLSLLRKHKARFLTTNHPLSPKGPLMFKKKMWGETVRETARGKPEGDKTITNIFMDVSVLIVYKWSKQPPLKKIPPHVYLWSSLGWERRDGERDRQALCLKSWSDMAAINRFWSRSSLQDWFHMWYRNVERSLSPSCSLNLSKFQVGHWIIRRGFLHISLLFASF